MKKILPRGAASTKAEEGLTPELVAAVEESAQAVFAGGTNAEAQAAAITNNVPSADVAKLTAAISARVQDLVAGAAKTGDDNGGTAAQDAATGAAAGSGAAPQPASTLVASGVATGFANSPNAGAVAADGLTGAAANAGKVLVSVPKGFILRISATIMHEIRAGVQWLERELAEHDYSKKSGVKIFDPKAQELETAVAALPIGIKTGQYKDVEYVVNGMRNYFGDLFTPTVEAQVRALPWPAPAKE